MAFSATFGMSNGTAQIVLSGELDATVSAQFRAQVEQADRAKAQQVVLIMHDLTYMSSAGLRELVFIKQKMGLAVDIYLVGVQDSVLETLKMTGVHQSVIILDNDAAI